MSSVHFDQGSITNQEVQTLERVAAADGVNDFFIQLALKQLSGLQEEEEMQQENNENQDFVDDDDDEEEEEEDAVLTGFRFCAEEAIRFLTEEEHFSPSDPVILELKQHLQEQQTRLLLQQQKQGRPTTDDTEVEAEKEEEGPGRKESPPTSSSTSGSEDGGGSQQPNHTRDTRRDSKPTVSISS